ncbi:flagellar hook capping FlgD N-terminal domain-containing protein [Maricaulis sp.]|uniref:flagellar hook assembly protein FlgD n=1 Tax=Maricaulis sp. TaxID=1486257 RepID=UPI0025C57264|nr:flagellar hook capping FlgD N-terminal domain-containing protein [Maricaulis sp.]
MVDAVSGIGSSSPALSNSQTGLADNFEMFLTLLTEQMKNQDPLNPLDSTQFVNQLVDFSSVEQQIAQNQNLENLLLLQSAAAQSASVSYIGRVATALTPQAMLTDGEASWEYTLPSDATTSSIIIRDEDDRIVARHDGETNTGSHDFTWDGLGDGGAAQDEGVYTMEVIAQNADGDNIEVSIQAAALVSGVDLSGSEVVVEMGGIRVPLSSVMSIKDANT